MRFKAKASFVRKVGETSEGHDITITATIKMPFEVESADRASAFDGVREICNELGLSGIEIELFEQGDGFKSFEEEQNDK